MLDIIRDLTFGVAMRKIVRMTVFAYPEERKEWKLPLHYGPAAAESGEKQPGDLASPSIAQQDASPRTTLVSWISDSDPANPQNWSSKKKLVVSAQICLYTFTVYTGSSIYVSGESSIGSEYHVGATPAELGLALYVFAYGIGPMLWSPLSEIPYIGRNTVYICTYTIFVALSLAASLVNNLAGLLVLRFMLGFFG